MRYNNDPVILRAVGRTRLTCAVCHAQFEVPFRHRVETFGDEPKLDRFRAKDRVIDDEIDFHRGRACPECGAAPANTVGASRDLYDLCVATLGMSAVVGLAIFGATVPLGAADANMLMIAMMASAACQMIGHAAVALLCGTAASNKARQATTRLEADVLEPHVERSVPKFRWPNRQLGTVLLAGAIAAPAAPFAFLASKRADANDGAAPALAGPGDRPSVEMTSKLISLKGEWCGTAEATATNADALGLKRSTIVAKVPSTSLEGRHFNSNDHETTFHPNVRIDIPNEAALEGRSLELDIRVEPTVATRIGFQFDTRKAPEIRERHSLRVASKADAQLYLQLLYGSLIASSVCACAAGGWYWLCNRRLRKCPAPEVYITRMRSEDERLKSGFSWKEHRTGGGENHDP